MWPIWLIVVVAAIASGVLLVVGVVLAITFERRRYRRYVERHTAGASLVTDKEASPVSDSGGDIAHCQSPIQKSSLNSHTTWITSPSTSIIEPDQSMNAASRESKTSELARSKSLHKTLRSTIRKRRNDRRCLQQKVSRGNQVNSPLSVITEVTDCTQVSPAHRSESSACIRNLTPDAEKEKDMCRWPFEKLEHHTSTTQDGDHKASKEYSSSHSQTFCESSIGPNSTSPISQLMHSMMKSPDDVHGNIGDLSTSSSTSTIESTSSSVLRLTPANHRPVSRSAEKTRSQALNDFEFDIEPTIKVQSPKHVTSPVRQSQQAVAMRSSKASMSLGARPSRLPRLKVKQEKWPFNAELIAARATSLSLAPSGRYSMIENVEVLMHQPSYNLSKHKLGHDPFMTGISSRPASVESRIPLHNLNFKTSTHDGPSRHGAPIPRTVQWHGYLNPVVGKLRNLSTTYSSTLHSRTGGNGSETQLHTFEEMQDMKARGSPGSSKQSSLGTKYLHHGRLEGASPATPRSSNSGSDYNWKFDFILGSSPKPSATSSPLRSYNSPVLPPPAYTQASLYPRPLQPKVMGPRSPRRAPIQSPLNPNTRLHHKSQVNGAVRSNSKRRKVSPDLLRSIQILRSMNSDCQLPKLSSGLGSQLTSLNETNNDFSNSLERREARKAFHDTSLASNHPSPATSRIPTPRPQSSSSVGGISVWEDVSVYDDSPKPEMPRAISFTGDMSPMSKIPFVTRVESKIGCISRTSTVSEHDYENDVQLGTGVGKKVGLGLNFVKMAVPDTPRSMYDEKGFLRV